MPPTSTPIAPPPAGSAGGLTLVRRKVYPRSVSGPWRTLRWALSALLQALLFLGPWVKWQGRQAILFDLAARKFHLFGTTFWPQETYFLLIILIFLALTLFASTALAGRVWCGYACPQTLFTDSFLLVERWLQGDRARRMALDASPWRAEKILRKAATWAIWAVMATWLGITFVAYFYPSDQLLQDLFLGQVKPGTAGVVAFFAALALFDFGWFREQMCHYACPYARFQGAMFDADTLVVAYDRARGEPRGRLGTPGAGDCVDCTLCVQVCPMGIDIRNGLQLECIACTACIDACKAVMRKLGRPGGLIRYSSLAALEGRPTRLLRPRLVAYALALAALAGLFFFLLARRPMLEVSVVRQVGQEVFLRTPDGRIANSYLLKLINKEDRPRRYRISVSGPAGAELVTPSNPLEVAGESAVEVPVMVLAPARGLPAASRVRFTVAEVDGAGPGRWRESSFLGPGS
jgi:cytochrome c oxidase accessory protein FixG